MDRKDKNKRALITRLPDFGKVPPQANDMEEAVLGGILVDSDAGIAVLGILKPESFYREAHQKIYQAVCDLAHKGHPVDLYTVTERLRANQLLDSVGGPVYITQLTMKIVSAANIEYYARIITQKYIQRELIRVSTEIQSQAFDDSIDLKELIEFAEGSLYGVMNFTQAKEPLPLSKCVDEFLTEVEKIYTKEKSLTGLPSGYTAIDRKTGGWIPGDLIVIAARPSMGKTAFAIALAKNAAQFQVPVAVFSLEMSTMQLTTRLFSGETGYTNVELRNAEVTFDRLVGCSHTLAALPIYIDDTPGLSIYELRSKVKKLILKYGVKMIVIDYLQLMTCDAQSREQEVSAISRGLKLIAKEFHIPVIVLSQLNREVEAAKDKRPKLQHLRESGAIEQDADIVMFLYNPCKCDIHNIDIDGTNLDTKNMLIIDGGKNRNGALFSIPLYYNDAMTAIKESKEELIYYDKF